VPTGQPFAEGASPAGGPSFDGKVVVVTGASSGLGAGSAAEFARRGARVVAGARRVDRLEQLVAEVERAGGAIACRAADVTSPSDCERLAELAVQRFGAVDVLVNAAGVGAAVPATREEPDAFRSVVDTNLMGSYWAAQACARRMRPGSSIVNVTSILAFTSAGLPQAAYASSKAAIVGLTRDLAQQWSGRKGIRVNAIAPGFFATEMTDELASDYLTDIVARRVPLGRMGELGEFTAAVCFLAGPDASFITGVTLPVDGGLLTN
jgi:NAD(P)-dependent dehydrogenase (short-subunit alcohol dehydrogenase family)